MPFLRALTALFLLLLLPALALAEAYYVAPVQGEGLDPALLKTVERLIAASVNEAGQTAVDSEAQAAWTLKPELLKLGSSLIVTLAKAKAAGGETAFANKMKAAGEEELDTVISRLTRSVVEGRAEKAAAKVGEVTSADAVKLTGKRVESRRSTYFGLGPMRFNGLGTPPEDSLGYYLTGGLQFDVTAQAAITLLGEASFRMRDAKSGAFLGGASLGGLYYFSDGDTAPYAGLDLGYGSSTDLASPAAFGFTGGARLGVMFFRTGTTQLSVALRHLSLFESTPNGSPSHSGLVLGVNF